MLTTDDPPDFCPRAQDAVREFMSHKCQPRCGKPCRFGFSGEGGTKPACAAAMQDSTSGRFTFQRREANNIVECSVPLLLLSGTHAHLLPTRSFGHPDFLSHVLKYLVKYISKSEQWAAGTIVHSW
jgi:hypothetical protein